MNYELPLSLVFFNFSWEKNINFLLKDWKAKLERAHFSKVQSGKRTVCELSHIGLPFILKKSSWDFNFSFSLSITNSWKLGAFYSIYQINSGIRDIQLPYVCSIRQVNTFQMVSFVYHFIKEFERKLYQGAFNNYVDQILTNLDPLPPRVDKRGH